MLGSGRPMTGRLVLLLSLSVALIAGCGDTQVEPASSSTDVNTLLRDTFRNLDQVGSANVSAKLAVDGAGESVTAALSGPFQSQGKGKLPKLQLAAKLEGGGQSFNAGVTWLGDKGYVNLQGINYEVSGLVAKQFEAGYEEAAKQQKSGGANAMLLGVDFSKWLKNGRNEGDADVAGTDTIKLTGEADVAQVIADVQRIAQKASTLKLPGTQDVPTKLTPEQEQEIVSSVKKFAIEVYTGKEDRILRKLVVNADLQEPSSKQTSHVVFELTLNAVGEDQDFSAPKNAKPFSELVKVAQGFSIFGSGSSGAATDGAAGSANLDKYAKCIDDAQGDTSKMQQCADLIGG
jgi:hypothetical protein